MSKSGVQGNFYLGTVASVPKDGNFEIVADIPGVIRGVKAFPLRGDCDEPKPGDAIILLGLDPEYNSYYLYWKLKENDFTGFRAYGKEISIEEEALVIRSYSGENSEDGEHEPGEEGRVYAEADLMTTLDLARALFRGFRHFANVLDLAIKDAEERQEKEREAQQQAEEGEQRQAENQKP